MSGRAPLFTAPVAKSKARVSLKKAPTTSVDTSTAALDHSSDATISPPPVTRVPAQAVGATAVDLPAGDHLAPLTRKKKKTKAQ